MGGWISPLFILGRKVTSALGSDRHRSIEALEITMTINRKNLSKDSRDVVNKLPV